MLRGGTGPGAAYYAAYVTPSHGIEVQYRDTDGGIAAQQASPAGTVPAYLEVARSGTTFTAYTSADGSSWTPVPGSTVSLSSLSGTILAGLAVTAHNTGTASNATFTGVTITGSAPAPPNLCPSAWTCEDIGFPTPAGSETLSGSTWTVQGGGGDMWGTSDQMRLISQPQAHDGTVTAQVTSQSDTDPWAKSGLMVRLTDSPSAPYYAVLLTPGNGVVVQYRSQQHADTAQITGVSGSAPAYLRVGRSGDTFTAYTSADGVDLDRLPGLGRHHQRAVRDAARGDGGVRAQHDRREHDRLHRHHGHRHRHPGRPRRSPGQTATWAARRPPGRPPTRARRSPSRAAATTSGEGRTSSTTCPRP